MPRAFPFLKVGGSHYDIGLQIGQALRDTIPQTINQIFDHELAQWQSWTAGSDMSNGLTFTRAEVFQRTYDFLPLFEQYCPAMLDELRGIERGAGITFEEALLLQIRGEVLYAATGGCSSFVFSRQATRDGQIIIGQNWDYAVSPDLLMVLQIEPDDGPSQLMMTFAGLTSYMGINAAGIGNFANALPWGWCKLGIPHYPFKWRVLQQTDLDGIRQVAQETQTIQPGNYVFCDAGGQIADLELTPEGPVWLEDREGFFVHTNHFLGEPFASRDDLSPVLADSLPRYERLHSLAEAAYGQITVSLVQEFLSDHENYPVSLCRHEDPPGMFTSASLIAEPERGVLHVCAGNPCEGEFVSYCF